MGSAPTISIAASVRRRSSRPTARSGRNAKPTPRSTIFFAVSIVSTSSATLGTSPALRKRPWVSVQSLEPRSKKMSDRSATSSRRARRCRPGQAAGRAGVEELLGVGTQRAPRRGERHAVLAALEEPHAQRVFEGANARAHGRLSEAERFGGAPEAAEGADREERLDLRDFHEWRPGGSLSDKYILSRL